ncbi:MAG: PLP-dependent transferase, partial [Bacteroidota bacterium]|nr:PLP-dependent transferase [Bacteroidota bacterium]
NDMKRRDILKGLSILPLGAATVFQTKQVFARTGIPAYRSPLVPGPRIFQSIGVEPLINCMGTYTIIGGSLERQNVREAMDSAARNFVQYDELANGVGKRLAELTKAEWGMVSAGCAAGMKHVTAACVTGGNPEKLVRIPDLTNFEKTEVVIPRPSRNVYDHAIRNIGVTIITVDTLKELQDALNERTAMVYFLSDGSGDESHFTVEAIANLTRPKKIPLLVNAAAEDLTVPCVHLEKGASVVAYSGGKALCGPQCSGILLGQKDILQSAWQASSPHHGPGRDNKVGREEMIGALAAVEEWVIMDHKAQWNKWLTYLDTISKKVSTIQAVKTFVREPESLNNNTPVLLISWDPLRLYITPEEAAEELGRNKPRIAVAVEKAKPVAGEPAVTFMRVNAGQMQPDEDKIVADRIYEVLSKKRTPKPPRMKTPVSSVAGRWDLTIEYYTSKTRYTWMLEQNENWIQGIHSGKFSTQNIAGTIDGDQIQIKSQEGDVENRINFTFTGKLSGDSISGSVYMVEYGTVRFVASRYSYKEEHHPIFVPAGPPLST